MTIRPPADPPLGMSTRDAAQWLGVSIGTVRRWADLGYLPCKKTPGGQRRFAAADLDAFVAGTREGER